MEKSLLENKKAKVFCYSGTGNSLVSAKMIADELDANVIFITEELSESCQHIEAEVCVIVFPVYAYAMPKTMKRWIKNSSFSVEYMAVIGTIGSKHGGALSEAIRLLKRRKCKTHYTMGLKCVENFVHMFKLPNEEKIKALCENQKKLTSKIIEDIKEKRQNSRCLLRPESFFVSFVYRRAARLIASRYKVLNSCNGCGICYRVCPPKAISIENDAAKIHSKKCDGCQGCMQLCPQKAIKFARIHPESKHFYKHPDITVADLFKRETVTIADEENLETDKTIENGLVTPNFTFETEHSPTHSTLSEETKTLRKSMFNAVIEMRSQEVDEE
ncbi:MAG: EFR1 family ferrodoxin [Firmicutes bacterium]|nr:EFR1 family ferrodoxin [Bacillota bacterium]